METPDGVEEEMAVPLVNNVGNVVLVIPVVAEVLERDDVETLTGVDEEMAVAVVKDIDNVVIVVPAVVVLLA